MKLMVYISLFIGLMVPQVSTAQNLTSSEPTSHPRTGWYLADGESPFENESFFLRRWAETYLLRAHLQLSPDEIFPVEILLTLYQKNVFDGYGKLTVTYGNGAKCKYPVRLVLYSYVNKIYLKDYAPDAVPKELTAEGRCKSPGKYDWRLHPLPYKRFTPGLAGLLEAG